MLKSMSNAREPIGWRDIALAIAFGALGILLMYENVADDDISAPAAAVPVFLLVTVPVLWRRREPLLVIGATLAGLLIHIAVFGTVVRCGVALPLAFVLSFTAGARLERTPALLGLAGALGVALAVTLSDTEVEVDFLPVLWPLTAGLWGIGRVVRSRGRLVTELQDRTTELRTARDDRARFEVTTDRSRLSSELDELLHRRLHELSALAEAGAAGSHAASPAETLAVLERDSRRTLEEMRTVVGTLRSDAGAAPVSPQPTLTHLEALLVHAKGESARLTVAGNPRALPAGVELSAYRVVEHLLEALEDAPGVDVGIRFDPEALEITVAGPARRRGAAGSAVERARQRVALHDGTLRSSVRAGRSEAVVQLPVAARA